jgi:Tol biopolymer transport system component
MRRLALLGMAVLVGAAGSSTGVGSAAAAAPGANGKIAFFSDRDVPLGDIYVRDLAATSATRLTFENAASPAWSPDGSRLAYTAGQELYVIKPDGSGRTQLTNNTFGDWLPAWSTRGNTIAFVTNRDLNNEIYTMRADGSSVTRLTMDPAADTTPTFSPDGTKIAFSSDRRAGCTAPNCLDIYVMNADGTAPTALTATSASDISPSWSPDGTRIAFGSSRDHTKGEIYVMNADGSNVIRLTNNSFTDRAPEWSPDGTRIAFESDRDGDWDIWMIEPNGANPAHLTDSPTDEGQVAWQPLPPPRRVTVGLVDPDTGQWHLRDDAVAKAWSFFYGDPGDVPFMGDWDCDGVDTPGLFRLSNAYAYLRNSNSQGIADIRFFFGNPDDVPLAGDWNGDGCDTLSLYRPSEQRFYIVNKLGANEGGLGPADYSFVFGDPGDKPVSGDWDADGITEVGLHRESTGFFYYRTSLDTGIASGEFYFGDPGDRFVAGDWGTVDGIDTPAIYRPSNTTFYFRTSNTPGVADYTLGSLGPSVVNDEPDWLPVAGAFFKP